MNNKGFTLIEMIVAVLIVGIGILGIFSFVSKFSEQSQYIRDVSVAANLGQEAIEIVKNIRDYNKINGLNWNAGLTECYAGCEIGYDDLYLSPWTGDGRFLYIENGTGYYKYIDLPQSGDIKTYYKRRVTITPTNVNELHIRVDIYWEGNGYELYSKIYNW
ncbi:MAG: prepilin-type N-terminal cleavage/methylation domain-containing protein [Candidatus Pacebacteria bacterium]|nr:prepilin-type N-terminal cleavage/methylation domain-containing protein [Candidatus Paceibacterota bacterium]MDD4074415.1 prepilin-type N-terminal cleavage/methylation domain-containing protein [Candidatus Paceibacterota bacterium]